MADVAAAPAWQAFVNMTDKQVEMHALGDLQQAIAQNAVAIQQLCVAGLAELAGAHVLGKAQDAMYNEHIERFWAQLGQSPLESAQLDLTLVDALQELSTAFSVHCQAVEALTAKLLQCHRASQQLPELPPSLLGLSARYRRAVGALLRSSAPISLPELLERYYADRLAEFSQASGLWSGGVEDEEAEDGDKAEAMEVPEPRDAGEVMDVEWVTRLRGASQALAVLGMQEESSAACAAAVCSHVRRYLHAKADGNFSRGVLSPALAYVAAVPLPFIGVVTPQQAQRARPPAFLGAEQGLGRWAARLGYYVYETLGRARIAQLFDALVEYPDSRPALADVRECMARTSLHAHFVAAFGASIRQRLLHAGAATLDIIAQYVATIKALREVDPAGVLLDAVGEPIKAYLRQRSDTVRCVVASLTDDGGGGAEAGGVGDLLFEELSRPADAEDAENEGDVEDFEGLCKALSWQPDPAEVDLAGGGRRARGGDIIAMLVAIYGSKELFINEYRSMLAEKLLTKTDYDCEREIRTLELLKLRFGDANLHNCEVMLRDLADSKRVNANIKALPEQALSPLRRARRQTDVAALDATVVSALFWPPVQEEPFVLPAEVQVRMEAYAARFYILKTPRKLVWRPQLGAVDLSLRVGGTTLDLVVTPLQATLLLQFKDRAEWPAQELAAAVGLSADALRRRIMFWVNQGVVQELRGAAAGQQLIIYRRAEALSQARRGGPGGGGGAAGDASAMEEDTMSGAGCAAIAQDMAVCEQYVMGMLTNVDTGLALDRIHNMLKMFMVDPPYNRTQEDLAVFLRRLVADEKLTFLGGVYKKR